MSRMVAIFSAAVLCVAVGTAHAQPRRGTSELFVFGGGSLLSPSNDGRRSMDDDIGPGRMFGASGMFGPGTLFGPGGMFGGPSGIFGPGGLFGPLDVTTVVFPNYVEERRALGQSFLFGVQYGYYITDRATLEGTFAVAPSHKLTRDFRFSWRCPDGFACAALDALQGSPLRMGDTNVVAYHYGANVGFDLARGTWRPMVLAGLGGVSFDGEGESRTSFVFRFGGGVKGTFGRIGLRADVADNLVFDHFVSGGTEHDLQVRGGLLLTF